ncbi:hypothetical protein VPAG_00066 [Vibrio phage douglas 12A4]|uniref:hypothetical protein n=1 Tax=Vibrio phage douglas 12A4 TaxID=573171 RepID=UPI0002C115F9|nr:hypothetical protein VPAG_00066 [Vibrio phage douglas 12A4]AGG58102.1 hypothetical protein VPAG_00066 [Vibrio phage douglas 12A4]
MSGGGADEVEETEYQKELAKVAQDEWKRYQDKYVPLENKFIQDVQKMGSEQTYKDMAGDVNTQYQKSFTEAGDQQRKQLAAAGVDPSSGKSQAARVEMADAQAGGATASTSKAQHDVSKAYTGGLSNVTAMGKGQQTQATAGLQDISQASLNEATQDAILKSQETSIPGAILGVGASYATNNPEQISSMFTPSSVSLDGSVGDGVSTMKQDPNYGVA